MPTETPSRLLLRQQAAQVSDEERKAARNKAERDSRFSKLHHAYNGYKSQIISLFDRAVKEHLSWGTMLDYRRDWIYGPNYKSLPEWVKHKIEGVWDTCVDLHYRHLTVCYPH